MSNPFTPDEPQVIFHDHALASDKVLGFIGMGVGKTAACLLTLRTLMLDLDVTAALVVAPNRVARLTWPEEVRDWDEFKWLRVADLRTPRGKEQFMDGKANLYCITYESLHIVTNMVRARNGVLPYEVEIWDELTMAKNPSSKRVQRFRRGTPRTQRRWGLTGTPMPNSELDLFAQVRLIDDGQRLGEAFMRYRETYFQKADWMGYKWEIREGASQTIEGRISDITLTMRSKDWVDIPEPVVEDVEVSLPDSVMEQYKQFEKDLILELEAGGQITAANAAVLVTKLLQFTSGASYDSEGVVHWVHEAKMVALKQIIAAASGPVLVAVNFKHEQTRIKKLLGAELFSDATTPAAQAALKDRWNRGEVPVLVAHPKSVGHGLNLQHGGHEMVWVTLTYSREGYEQMICRLARRGQKNRVKVHRLICPGTVDEVVATVLASKADTETKLLNSLSMLEALRK